MNTFEESYVQDSETGFSPDDPLQRDREDRRAVREFLAGRRDALGDLFRRYRKDVYAIAHRFTGNKDDALDVTQEVFLKLIERMDEFERSARFSTWLYRVAVNQSIDCMRRRRRRAAAPLGDAVVEVTGGGTDPVERAERREVSASLMHALDQLSDKHRSVIVLHGLENLSYKEIARVMGCSEGTVMSRLYYARKYLAEILGR